MKQFLAERYIGIIEILKSYRLWNLDYGLILLPYVQHCMPPPNPVNIRSSMAKLIDMEVNTDWFPIDEMQKIIRKIPRQGNHNKVENAGTDYPIDYAIHRIHAQKEWSLELKRKAAIQFIEFVYRHTGPESQIYPNQYYSDVYGIRDVYISTLAWENHVKTSGSHNKILSKKQGRMDEFERTASWIGKPSNFDPMYKRSGFFFWNHPPTVQFQLEASPSSPSDSPIFSTPSQEDNDRDETKDIVKIPPSDRENLVPKLLVKWARQNVRSEADAGALSWGTIFRYWEFLLTKSRVEQFLISVLALTTGIPKKRWESLSSDEITLKQGGLVISPAASHLVYRVQNIAGDFSQTPADKAPINQCLQLSLPTCWQHFFSVTETFITQGIKEESSLRGFSRKHGGVTPTINRVARSGHALLRREFLGELRSHILSGNIPIELQNRSAYQAVSNQKINEGFQDLLQALIEKSVSHMSEFPRVHAALQEIDRATFEPCSDHMVGSQLSATSKTLFKAPKLLPGTSGLPLKTIVSDLNQLELYYFWMQQFAMADRAVGELTATTFSGAVRWHRDKDSHEHEESKIHLAPDLLLQQFHEIQKARSYLQKIVTTYGQELVLPSNDHRAMLFKVAAQNTVKARVFDSKAAQGKAAELWGYRPPYDRSNAHRHSAATSTAEHYGEIQADVLLGHHVDGWDLFAPESSAKMDDALKELKTASGEAIAQNGFKLLRSPWQ